MSKKRNPAPRSESGLPVQEPPSAKPVAVRAESSWSGPIPSPDQLARFDAVVPGSAERILNMAEQEGEHARDMQRRAVKAAIRLEHLGQGCAFVFAAGAVMAAYRLAMAGHDMVAGILIGTTLATIVIAFLDRRKPRD